MVLLDIAGSKFWFQRSERSSVVVFRFCLQSGQRKLAYFCWCVLICLVDSWQFFLNKNNPSRSRSESKDSFYHLSVHSLFVGNFLIDLTPQHFPHTFFKSIHIFSVHLIRRPFVLVVLTALVSLPIFDDSVVIWDCCDRFSVTFTLVKMLGSSAIIRKRRKRITWT